MKKVILIIALIISIIFLISISIFSSKIFSGNFCSLIPTEDSDAIQLCCNNWAIENNIGHIKCAGKWMIKDGECSYACNLPPEPGPLHYCIYASQTNKTKDELVQECCNEWATENQILHAQCLGEWGYFGGYECKWGCFI